MFAFFFIYVLLLKALALAITVFSRVFLQAPLAGLPLGVGSGPGSSYISRLIDADADFSYVKWERVSPCLAEQTSPFSCTSLSPADTQVRAFVPRQLCGRGRASGKMVKMNKITSLVKSPLMGSVLV